MKLLTLFLSINLFPILGNIETKPTSHTSNIQELFTVANSPYFWVSVHAMEYLAKLGLKKEARQLALSNLKAFQGTPEKRIGYWRVQSMAAASKLQRIYWTRKIKKAYIAKSGPDRIHAAESLAKLGISFKKFNQAIVVNDLNSSGMLFSFCNWGVSVPKDRSELPNYSALLKEISNENLQRRSLAAYAFSFLTTNMKKGSWDTLATIALKEDLNSTAYVRLIVAAYVHYPHNNRESLGTFLEVRERLLRLENSPKITERMELCLALAQSSLQDDLPIIERVLFSAITPIVHASAKSIQSDSSDKEFLDLKAAASYAWLKRNSTINK
jgi:SSS family solute:Na+ symporter